MISRKQMLVVCHDAGGAEIISAFIKGHPDAYIYKILVGGPAIEIFKRKGIRATSILDNHKNWSSVFLPAQKIDVLLAGADWASDMSLCALRAAKEERIYTIVYLDHWVCYRERFGYPNQEWKSVLPDEFWVGDEYGLQLAQNLFPNSKIRLEPNLYFKEIKNNFQDYLSKISKRKSDHTLLFISEPVSAITTVLRDVTRVPMDERNILERLLSVLVSRGSKTKIRIRFHPSEKFNKYDDILAKYNEHLTIEKSLGKSIYEDIAESYLVVGMESMALVIALLCGAKVISLLPDCLLPFREVLKVGDINKITAFVK